MADEVTGIEIRHLLALRAVAETSSFSKAAERLGYAQSAVSQQIAALERIVGTRLVERPGGPRPVSLTEAGEVLAAHGDRILGRLAAARADLRALVAGEAGTVRIGTFQSAGARILPNVLRRYRSEWPDVRIELSESDDDVTLAEMVTAGVLDLSFGVRFEDAEEEAFEFVELVTDHYHLLCPPDSPFRDFKSVSLGALDGMDMIAPSTDSTCWNPVERAWERAGAAPNVLFRTDDNLAVHRLVCAGLGHAVLADLAIEPLTGADEVAAVPLEHVPARQIGLRWSRGRRLGPAAQAFVETASALYDVHPVA